MRITIVEEINECYRIIYLLTLQNNEISYDAIHHSRRNDSEDTWGDEWLWKYKDNILKAWQKLEDKYELDYADHDREEEEQKIAEKYNPCMNKTKDGFPYYSGTSFSQLDDHKIPMSVEKLKAKIEEYFKNLLNSWDLSKICEE